MIGRQFSGKLLQRLQFVLLILQNLLPAIATGYVCKDLCKFLSDDFDYREPRKNQQIWFNTFFLIATPLAQLNASALHAVLSPINQSGGQPLALPFTALAHNELLLDQAGGRLRVNAVALHTRLFLDQNHHWRSRLLREPVMLGEYSYVAAQ